MATDVWIDLGYVARTHGVRGTLHIHWHDSDGHLQPFPQVLQLEAPRGTPRTLNVRAQRRHKNGTLVDLEGITDLDAACELKGATVRVAEHELPQEAPGEVYLYRLMGATCRNVADGRILGTLQNIYHHGASVVLGIQPEEDALAATDRGTGDEVLVPLLDRTLRRRHKAQGGAPQVLDLELLPDFLQA